jgi:hypothetical protein
MDALKEATERLRALGTQRPTPERWAEVATALESKFEGVQVVAGRVIANWGGRPAVEALRPWLVRLCERRDSLAARGAAAEALSWCVEAEDTEWILDLYFSLAPLTNHDILPLVGVLSPDRVRPRIKIEARSSEAVNRWAALRVVSTIRFPDRRELLRMFVDDPRKRIYSTARLLLSREA